MANKLQYKGRNPNRTYDIGLLLTKKRDTLWDKLPVELCEVIYNYYIMLRQELAKSYLPELTDNDIYSEMRYRNRKCFTGFDLGRTDLYSGSTSEMKDSINNIFLTFNKDLEVFPGHGNTDTVKNILNYNSYLKEFING